MEQKMTLGRKIAFVLLIIWCGAFTFYAGILVPIGIHRIYLHISILNLADCKQVDCCGSSEQIEMY